LIKERGKNRRIPKSIYRRHYNRTCLRSLEKETMKPEVVEDRDVKEGKEEVSGGLAKLQEARKKWCGARPKACRWSTMELTLERRARGTKGG
jgi:hypothetical protein